MSRAKVRVVELEAEADDIVAIVACVLDAEQPPAIEPEVDEDDDEDEEPETCACDESLGLRRQLEEAQREISGQASYVEALLRTAEERNKTIADHNAADAELRRVLDEVAPLASKANASASPQAAAATVLRLFVSRMPKQERQAQLDVEAMKAKRDADWLDEIQVLVVGDVSPSRSVPQLVRDELNRLRGRLAEIAKRDAMTPPDGGAQALANMKHALDAKTDELSAASRANGDLVLRLQGAEAAVTEAAEENARLRARVAELTPAPEEEE